MLKSRRLRGVMGSEREVGGERGARPGKKRGTARRRLEGEAGRAAKVLVLADLTP